MCGLKCVICVLYFVVLCCYVVYISVYYYGPVGLALVVQVCPSQQSRGFYQQNTETAAPHEQTVNSQ